MYGSSFLQKSMISIIVNMLFDIYMESTSKRRLRVFYGERESSCGRLRSIHDLIENEDGWEVILDLRYVKTCRFT